MPFYAFGPLRITAVRNIESVASVEGPPAMVECPLGDSLRSVYPLFALCGLLLLRRVTRTRAAWALLLPLAAIYAASYIGEAAISHLASWYATPSICSTLCEMLRALALGLAFLLALSDLIRVRHRFLGFLLTSLVIFIVGAAAILLNAPFALESWVWVVAFGFLLLIFRLGLSLLAALLRKLSRRDLLPPYAGVCLLLGVGSILILTGAGLASHSVKLLSTQHLLLYVAAVPQPFLAPYFVFFWFVLLALLSPFYRQRFTDCLVAGPS